MVVYVVVVVFYFVKYILWRSSVLVEGFIFDGDVDIFVFFGVFLMIVLGVNYFSD